MNEKCELCNNNCNTLDIPKDFSNFINKSPYMFNCSSCGYYIIPGYINNKNDLRNYLFYNNNSNSNNVKKDLFIYLDSNENQDKLKNIKNDKYNLKIISELTINLWKPKNLKEKVNMILRKLNKNNKYIGQEINLNILSLFFSETNEENDQIKETYFLFNYFKSKELLSFIFYRYDYSNKKAYKIDKKNIDLNLFIEWWEVNFKYGIIGIILEEKAYDFLIDNKVDSRNVFVAMNFPDENNWIKDCINEVLIENDLKMIHMKGYHHNNWIMDVIRDSIESSKFVICDFTQPEGKENSYGVYYESGFAEGKGKQVIHLCQKDSIDKLHFDILQKNYIEYKDEKELKKYLNLRIKAML
ncbi:MAG: hypothetical protein ACRDA7_01310 [Metamycoplasmataceae bacterium]